MLTRKGKDLLAVVAMIATLAVAGTLVPVALTGGLWRLGTS